MFALHILGSFLRKVIFSDYASHCKTSYQYLHNVTCALWFNSSSFLAYKLYRCVSDYVINLSVH